MTTSKSFLLHQNAPICVMAKVHNAMHLFLDLDRTYCSNRPSKQKLGLELGHQEVVHPGIKGLFVFDVCVGGGKGLISKGAYQGADFALCG